MNTTKNLLLIAAALLPLALNAAESKTKVQTLKSFNPPDSTITTELKIVDGQSWLVDCQKPQTIRLFEVTGPNVEACLLTYRAKLKTEGLTDSAYLEMWCRFPGKGEYFSRGLNHAVTGSNEWSSFETPFFLKKGEKPDLVKLNLVMKGTGKVWIKDVELIKGPLPAGVSAGK